MSTILSVQIPSVVAATPAHPTPPRPATYEGLGSVAFFTVLLLGLVIVKRTPKSGRQSHWSRRLLDWLRP